jgi:hypothetical protein
MDSALSSAQTAATTSKSAALEQFEEALGQLPVVPEQRRHIPSCARSLLLVSMLSRAKDTPYAQIGGTQKVRKVLDRTANLAGKLHNAIALMPGDALLLIREQIRQMLVDQPLARNLTHEPLAIRDDLANFARTIDRVLQKLAGAQQELPGPRRRKRRAEAVTEKAAGVYERLTGKDVTMIVDAGFDPPRPRGPFLEFLTKVFKTLKVQASPYAQARAFMEKRRKR